MHLPKCFWKISVISGKIKRIRKWGRIKMLFLATFFQALVHFNQAQKNGGKKVYLVSKYTEILPKQFWSMCDHYWENNMGEGIPYKMKSRFHSIYFKSDVPKNWRLENYLYQVSWRVVLKALIRYLETKYYLKLDSALSAQY